jgi:hypothetical protein
VKAIGAGMVDDHKIGGDGAKPVDVISDFISF